MMVNNKVDCGETGKLEDESKESKQLEVTPSSVHMYLGQGIANGSFSDPQLSCFDREEDGNQDGRGNKRRKTHTTEFDIFLLLSAPSDSR